MSKRTRILGIVLVLALVLGSVGVIRPQTDRAEAASSYWLTGGNGNSKLIFTGKKFKFSGKWGKAKSFDKSVTKYYDNPKRFKKNLKKGSGFITGNLEEDGIVYDQVPNIDKNTNLVGITIHVRIKNNRVKEVIYSAM